MSQLAFVVPCYLLPRCFLFPFACVFLPRPSVRAALLASLRQMRAPFPPKGHVRLGAHTGSVRARVCESPDRRTPTSPGALPRQWAARAHLRVCVRVRARMRVRVCACKARACVRECGDGVACVYPCMRRYKGFAPGVKDFTGIDIEKVQSIQASTPPRKAVAVHRCNSQ